MNRLKAGIKLLWPHIIIFLLSAAGIIASIVSFTNIRKQADALCNGLFVIEGAAETVNAAFETMQMSVFRAVSNDSREITDEALADAGNSAEIIREQIALIKQNPLGDTAIISKLETYLTELTPMQEHVLSLAARNKNAEAAGYMENRCLPVIKEAQKELAQLLQSADAKETELMASLRQTQRTTILLLVSLSVAGVLFSIGAGASHWRHKSKFITGGTQK